MTNEESREPDLSHQFDNSLDAPRGARNALGTLFPVADPIADDVTLVASELVTNVVQHTDSGGLMEAWDDDPFVISVTDFGAASPSPQVDPDDQGGRGLHIVDELANDWGTTSRPDGKTVWAKFDRGLNDAPE